MFKVLLPQETGVVTENPYDDPRMWGALHQVAQNGEIGTGLAIGDYDGDGRPDLFVVSKTRSCRLFRNLGDWKFEDVTESAGVGDKGEAAGVWKQGATFVDVDNNGLLDLYVCRYGAPNLLYINQGDGTFKEEAAARGLAVNDACVMAAFCDYDRDGHLDVFIQTNLRDSGHPSGQLDYLFHNNGDGTFTDITDAAGISGEAQGHSAVWWDYDGDGWPDLYVANDFAAPDKLYRNNRDGTFTDVIDQVVPHMPYSSMGSDLGDVDNDGRIDLFVAEMAATSHQKDQRGTALRRGLLEDPPDDSKMAPQVMRNALYLNTGTGRCMEAACLAGLAATDWTWSARLEDLDNDGRLDLLITNGMSRELHNGDLQTREDLALSAAEKVMVEKQSPVLSEQHLAFRNLGDLRFEDVSAAWGLNQRGVSFGAAFGDLDGDGNLDLAFANYEGGITLLRNDADQGRSIVVALRGTRSNRFGVGSVVRIETDSGPQVRTLVLARGALSNSEPILHFGVGADARIRKLEVSWPSGHVQKFVDLAVDKRFLITEPEAPESVAATMPGPAMQFSEVGAAAGFSIACREVVLDETIQQPLLPMRQNRRGPSLAVGDLRGGGPRDVVLGGTPRDSARVLFGDGDGGFAAAPVGASLTGDTLSDGPVLLFDADGDGVNDLLVTKGGSAMDAGSPHYQPRLFMNDGRGGLLPAPMDSLPPFAVSVGAVAAADFDRSGRLGLFLGGRVVPGQYPLSPPSALWANRGGRFEDVTDRLAPGLRAVGMVTGALWSDVDGDGWPDLLLTLEWGGVKYFHNDRGLGFEDWSARGGFAAAGSGWWTSIASADFNCDGRMDYVVGNVGLNTPYRASPAEPALLFYGDFGGRGDRQLVEAFHQAGRVYPWRNRRDLGAEIPSILRRYPRNDYYARATLGEILGEERLAAARRFEATEFRSGVFLGQADGTYRYEPLPRLAQVAPIQGLVAGDFDGDGNADIYAVQNSYSPIPYVGRFDGGLSQLLRGDGRGGFTVVPAAESGLVVPGDAKALAVADINQDGWPDFLVSRNGASTLAFRNNGVPGRHSIHVELRGPKGNPSAIGARVTLECADGSMQAAEICAGSGYYSQSSSSCFFGWGGSRRPRRLTARWPSGAASEALVTPGASSVVMTAPQASILPAPPGR